MHLVIVGLGNPGKRYENTLHNVGFKVVDKMAEMKAWKWKRDPNFQAVVTQGLVGEVKYHLMKPETFMNLSGEAVRAYLRELRLEISQLIVVADDADLPLGELRLKPKGGNGGHNGLKSISQTLHSTYYKRLKVGIGRSVEGMGLADYVLEHNPKAIEELTPAVEKGAEALLKLAEQDFEAVMKTVNTSLL